MSENENDLLAQAAYARTLRIASRAGFAAALAGLALYVSGRLPTLVPLDALPQFWTLPVDEYLRRSGAPSGWRWLALLDRGEYLALASAALLPLVTLLCYLHLATVYGRLGERLQAGLAIAQSAVLAAAASGLWL
jgi:hypothetical protein